MREADDTVKSLKEILNAAENLVEDGNKLLKQCVNKMNRGIFLDSQQKIELGQKRKKELNEELKLANEKRKELVQAK